MQFGGECFEAYVDDLQRQLALRFAVLGAALLISEPLEVRARGSGGPFANGVVQRAKTLTVIVLKLSSINRMRASRIYRLRCRLAQFENFWLSQRDHEPCRDLFFRLDEHLASASVMFQTGQIASDQLILDEWHQNAQRAGDHFGCLGLGSPVEKLGNFEIISRHWSPLGLGRGLAVGAVRAETCGASQAPPTIPARLHLRRRAGPICAAPLE